MSAFAGHTVLRGGSRDYPLVPSGIQVDHDSPLSWSISPPADGDMTSPTGHFLAERARYASTVTYQKSGSRNRGYSRSPRNLVVVIPPPNFPLRPGRLGNVLSKGPQHRLSHGILMPLFPSMAGQLNAIVREYNFPSTLGLCLYLHINEGGVTMTPRISEDSWQYLFSHLFDGHVPSGGQLPIGGSIEFDIDLHKARWFDPWVSGNLRESCSVSPPTATSPPVLETPWRDELQPLPVGKPPVEDQWNASGSRTLISSSRPETRRHLPRKLSLVDRLEPHVRDSPTFQNYHDRPDSTHGTLASSPILRSSSPRASSSDLERRVNSWRTNAEFSIVESYQPASDVKVSMGVTATDEYTQEEHGDQVVDIDEFLWSIASVGPHSSASESPMVSSRPSSVVPDHRVIETVLPTSTKTSSVPADDEQHSDGPDVSQLPSPNSGERVVEDVMVLESAVLEDTLSSAGDQEAQTLVNPDMYPVLDIRELSSSLELINVNLPTSYPLLVIYAAGYPWSLDSMYPTISVDDSSAAEDLQPWYPCIAIHPVVYPFVEPYPVPDSVHIPGTLDEDQYESAKAFLALLEPKPIDTESTVNPHSSFYPTSPILMPQQEQVQDVNGDESVIPHVAPTVQSHFDLYPPSPLLISQQEHVVLDADDGELATPHLTSALQSHTSLYLTSPKLMSQRIRVVHDAGSSEFAIPHFMSAYTDPYPVSLAMVAREQAVQDELVIPAVHPYTDPYPVFLELVPQREQAAQDESVIPAVHPYTDPYPVSLELVPQREQAVQDELVIPAVHPYTDPYPTSLALVPQQEQVAQDADGELVTPHAASVVYSRLDFYPDSPVLVPQEQAVQDADESVASRAASVVHPQLDFYPDSPVLVPEKEHAERDEMVTLQATSAVQPQSDFNPNSPALVPQGQIIQDMDDELVSSLHPASPESVPQQGRVIQDEDDDQFVVPLSRTQNVKRRQQRNHMDLRASVLRTVGKQPSRSPKTHMCLHTEVFHGSIVWTPSGSTQDLPSEVDMHGLPPTQKRRRKDKAARKSQRPPSIDIAKARLSRRSGITITQSPQSQVFPLPYSAQRSISPLRVRRADIPFQPLLGVSETPMPVMKASTIPALHDQRPDLSPPTSPLLVHSPELPAQRSQTLAVSEAPCSWPKPPRPRIRDMSLPVKPLPQPPLPTLYIRSPGSPPPPVSTRSPEFSSKQPLDIAVSETPKPCIPPPIITHIPRRTASARLSEAVRSMARMSGRKKQSSSNLDPEDYPERAGSPARMLSLTERRPQIIHEVPLSNTTPFVSRSLSAKESLVLQRVKAYEESIQADQSSGTHRSHTPYILRPLSSMPSN